MERSVKLVVFSPQNLMLDFEICESPGSKCAMADGHLSNSTAASNLSFLLKHQVESGIGFPEAKALHGP